MDSILCTKCNTMNNTLQERCINMRCNLRLCDFGVSIYQQRSPKVRHAAEDTVSSEELGGKLKRPRGAAPKGQNGQRMVWNDSGWVEKSTSPASEVLTKADVACQTDPIPLLIPIPALPETTHELLASVTAAELDFVIRRSREEFAEHGMSRRQALLHP